LGDSIREYVELVKLLSNVEAINGFEINISCPNVAQGMVFGVNPKLTFELVSAVRKATNLPLFVKLTPNVLDIVPIAVAAVDAGANALTLINTVKGTASVPDIRNGEILHSMEGGISGGRIKHIALRWIRLVAQANLGVPIIGVGGISNIDDVIEFIMDGATAVQIGTANFRDDMVMFDIIRALESRLIKEGVDDINDLIGRNIRKK